MTLFRLRNYLLSSLWFVPIVCVLAGVALSILTFALDGLPDGSLVPESLVGDADAARATLTTVALSMVTLTTLVLTITMVVVQLAMGQFTPRVLRTILRDRPSQFAIGIFVGTFAHAMLALRAVRAPTLADPDGYVPGLPIVVGYVLILICIMVLVGYVHHIGRSLTSASLIDAVGDDARELLDRLYPERRPHDETDLVESSEQAPTDRVIRAPSHGVVVAVDHDELVAIAREADVRLAMAPLVGDFVPEGAVLFEVHGDAPIEDDDVVAAVAFADERTMDKDLAFGLRMLVDVGVRSVSQAMGDPTTTTQSIDRIHDLLRQLAMRSFPSGRYSDERGVVRLTVPVLTWEGYVRLACDELRTYGRASMQVTRRLVAMLSDLLEVAPEERRPPLEEQLRLLREAVPNAFEDVDVLAARTADQQGIGSGWDVVGRAAVGE